MFMRIHEHDTWGYKAFHVGRVLWVFIVNGEPQTYFVRGAAASSPLPPNKLAVQDSRAMPASEGVGSQSARLGIYLHSGSFTWISAAADTMRQL